MEGFAGGREAVESSVAVTSPGVGAGGAIRGLCVAGCVGHDGGGVAGVEVGELGEDVVAEDVGDGGGFGARYPVLVDVDGVEVGGGADGAGRHRGRIVAGAVAQDGGVQ